MSGRSQQEAVNILRRTKGKVKLLIKRQVVDASSVGSNSKLMVSVRDWECLMQIMKENATFI